MNCDWGVSTVNMSAIPSFLAALPHPLPQRTTNGLDVILLSRCHWMISQSHETLQEKNKLAPILPTHSLMCMINIANDETHGRCILCIAVEVGGGRGGGGGLFWEKKAA